MTSTLDPVAYAPPPARPAAVAAPARSRRTPRGGALLQRLWRGAEGDPRWARPSLLATLVATAVLYLWDLTASGFSNDFYAAAAQAGSRSWTAWFFGGLDIGGAITVDKPPASTWVTGLSMRLFGVNSAALLVPEALMGVATAALVYGAVRRLSRSHGAGLLAAGICALTPSAVLVFRFDNPDALLVLLMTAAAYAVVRALEDGRTRWLVLAGTAIGFGFLTKMGQALLVVPALGAAYLLAGPHRLLTRLWQLLLAWSAVMISAGWYVAVAALWPASSRPYLAGSGDNTVLGLALGYNGLGRLFGGSGNGGGGGGGMGGNGGFGGTPGLGRLLRSEMGYEAGWLLPAALVALVGGLWLTRRTPRTGPTRAALVLWGGWLLVTAYTFSEMQGTIHPYYTAALAPALGGVIATTVVWAWRRRQAWQPRLAVAAVVAVAADWSYVLLHRSGWGAGYAAAALVLGVLTTAGVLLWAFVPRSGMRTAAAGLALAGVLAGGIGTAAWGVATASQPHTGSIPSTGPASASGQGGFGGGGPGGGGQTANAQLVALLKAASGYRWAAATNGSMTQAPLQLASGASVMAIGGFTGSDPAPTLAQFEAWVKAGLVKYYISGGGMGGPGGGGGSSSIASWVAANYTATSVGGTTVYDLQPSS